MNDPWARAAGAGFLLASAGSALVHREIFEAMRGVPEFMISLLAVALAIAGTLLLRGSKRFVHPAAPVPPTPLPQIRRDLTVGKLLAIGSPEAVLLDTRKGVALILAYKALAIAAEKRAIPPERLSDQAGMAYRRSAVRGRY